MNIYLMDVVVAGSIKESCFQSRLNLLALIEWDYTDVPLLVCGGFSVLQSKHISGII